MAKHNKLKIISAKDLGALNMPTFCPRCFWLERHLGKPPAVFPGIFSTLDALTKKSVHRSFKATNQKPSWLNLPNLADVVEDDIYFKLPVKEGDWVLTGFPDDIFVTCDDTYHIVDYKTAKFTKTQDELLPIYEVQLNAYAFLAEQYGLKPVETLSLVYCEPEEDLKDDERFELPFRIYSLEIERNQDILFHLLRQARAILEQKNPPPSYEKCKGICQWAGALTHNKLRL